MTMDLQIALVSVGFCVLSGVVVYLISVFGMKEKTYEEAIEEQRRRNQEALVKVDKPKKEKKYKKVQSKKKDKGEEEVQSVDQSAHHAVDFKAETEIIPQEAEAERPIKSSSRVSSGKKKSPAPPKSILVNKQEPTQNLPAGTILTPSIEEDQEDSSSTEPPAPTFVPMDEVERRHSLDAGTCKRLSISLLAAEAEKKSASPEKKKKEEPSPTKKVNNNNNSISNNNKRNKSEDEVDAPSGKKLLGWLKVAQLQDDEIQLLIDVLLNKQHQGTAEWTKRNDPLTQLKKQLQEREAALETEQRQSAAVNAKLREMRHELGAEKSQRANTDRLLKEKLAQHSQEVQTLQAQLQHQHDQHLQDKANMQSKLQQLQSKVSEEQELALQHLSEENSKLQQKLSRIDSERQNWTALESQQQMKLKQMQSACEHYEAAQLAHQQEREALESRIQQVQLQQQDEEYKFGQRMNEMSSQLAEAEDRCASMAQESARAREVERGALASRMEKAESERASLINRVEKAEAERTAFISRVEKAENSFRQKEQEMAHLREALEKEKSRVEQLQSSASGQLSEAERLSASLTEENQRLQAQLSEKLSGQAQEETTLAIEKEKALAEKIQLVASLEESLLRGKSQLAAVAQELESQKKKNNELREKNWKAMEAVQQAEKEAKDTKEQEK